MSRTPTVVVLFDGGCPLCRRTVRTLMRLDWLAKLQFADATDPVARARVAADLSEEEALVQMYAVDRMGRAGGFEAFLRIGRVVPVLWPAAAVGSLPVLRQIGRAVYRIVAARRARDGRCSDAACASRERAMDQSPPRRHPASPHPTRP